jgi:hypothetical protein
MIPFALATAAWTALAAMGGALVGAVAGGLVDAILNVLREKSLAKAGARLVASDIAMADSRLKAAEQEGKWWRFYELPTSSWPEYRKVLATSLGNDEFESVSQAAVSFQLLSDHFPKAPAFSDPNVNFVEIKPETIGPVRADAAAAYNALAELAGHDQVKDRIHE